MKGETVLRDSNPAFKDATEGSGKLVSLTFLLNRSKQLLWSPVDTHGDTKDEENL